MKINLPPMTGEAIFAARKAALALAEEKSKNTVAANTSSGENPPPIVTDHMRAQGNNGDLVTLPGQSTIERIREVGMSAYAEEIKAKKLEEMKEKLRKLILGEMGISEEELSKMAPKARAAIEKIIEDEIQKRLAAISEQQNEDKKKDGIFGQKPDGIPGGSLRGEIISRTTEFGPGFGVLLALQEAQANSGSLGEHTDTNGNKTNEGMGNTMRKDAETWLNFKPSDEQ